MFDNRDPFGTFDDGFDGTENVSRNMADGGICELNTRLLQKSFLEYFVEYFEELFIL